MYLLSVFGTEFYSLKGAVDYSHKIPHLDCSKTRQTTNINKYL